MSGTEEDDMGSEQFDRYPGLKRRSEGAAGDPRLFTVIGVDISAEALKAKYKGSKQYAYACDVIDAVVQKQRTAQPPPVSFINLCRGGIHEPIIVCDLGADAKGKSWMVVVDGRQRDLSARAINDEKTGVEIDVSAIFRPFKRGSAGLDATMVKVVANARVPRTYSQRAEDAADLRARGVANIAPLCEARDDAEVEHLIALNGCADEAKVAIDANLLPLAYASHLATLPPEEQVRQVARKLAGSSKKGRDAAAPPRLKTCPSRMLLGVGAAFDKVSTKAPQFTGKEFAAFCRWAAGDVTALVDAEYERVWKVVESGEAEMQAVDK